MIYFTHPSLPWSGSVGSLTTQQPDSVTFSTDVNYQASLPRADPHEDSVWVPGYLRLMEQTANPRRIPAKSLGVERHHPTAASQTTNLVT